MDARHKKGIRRRRADGPEPGLRKISPEIYSKENPSRGTTTKQNNKKYIILKKKNWHVWIRRRSRSASWRRPEPGLRKISPEIYSKENPSRSTTEPCDKKIILLTIKY
jgi:hypothetical protein